MILMVQERRTAAAAALDHLVDSTACHYRSEEESTNPAVQTMSRTLDVEHKKAWYSEFHTVAVRRRQVRLPRPISSGEGGGLATAHVGSAGGFLRDSGTRLRTSRLCCTGGEAAGSAAAPWRLERRVRPESQMTGVDEGLFAKYWVAINVRDPAIYLDRKY